MVQQEYQIDTYPQEYQIDTYPQVRLFQKPDYSSSYLHLPYTLIQRSHATVLLHVLYCQVSFSATIALDYRARFLLHLLYRLGLMILVGRVGNMYLFRTVLGDIE